MAAPLHLRRGSIYYSMVRLLEPKLTNGGPPMRDKSSCMRIALKAGVFLFLLLVPAWAQMSSVKTVFVILMENQNWVFIQGSSSAPYINNTVLPMSSYATQYYNPPSNHPSLPNYLWLEAGTNFGISDDN